MVALTGPRPVIRWRPRPTENMLPCYLPATATSYIFTACTGFKNETEDEDKTSESFHLIFWQNITRSFRTQPSTNSIAIELMTWLGAVKTSATRSIPNTKNELFILACLTVLLTLISSQTLKSPPICLLSLVVPATNVAMSATMLKFAPHPSAYATTVRFLPTSTCATAVLTNYIHRQAAWPRVQRLPPSSNDRGKTVLPLPGSRSRSSRLPYSAP